MVNAPSEPAAPISAPKPAKPEGKLSQLDAAVKVLAEAGTPMTTKAMIESMATKGYWTSPGGATPWATLYSASLRELQKKGPEAQFVKADRGQFTLNPATKMPHRKIGHSFRNDLYRSCESNWHR